jgi:epoxyqueuosine reductase
MRPQADTDWLVTQAQALGFDLCGVAPAGGLTEPARRDEWLARGYAGRMKYLHDARRANPAAVLPEAKSVIVCAVNYNTAQPYSTEAAALAAAQIGPNAAAAGGPQAAAVSGPQAAAVSGPQAAAVSGPQAAAVSGPQAAAVSGPQAWISRYAWGDDYHTAIGAQLDSLVAAMTEKFGREKFSVRAYVDTGPVSERVAARQAGLGWLAKNTCLINEGLGSWLFLGVVLTSLELAPSLPRADAGTAPVPPADLCGNCSLCLDACPTGALVEPYVLDARRCISYLTIELRDAIPEEFRAAMGWQVFGCDICQDVCPWNRQAPATTNPSFAPRENLVAPEIDWLLSLTEDDFRRIFQGSAVRRAKWPGLLRNACIAAGNTLARGQRSSNETGMNARLQARLTQLATSPDPLIAEHARWALAQFAATTGAAPSSPK